MRINIEKIDRENRLPFFAAWGFGLAAYGFWLTNKLPFDDDLPNMWNKGATYVSGRYGLELLRLVMPDWSMPWIYGLMSLLFLSLAVCVALRLFKIKSRLLQVLLAGVFVCFPAEAGTVAYTFTSAPYALALLLTVTGVWLFASEKRGKWLLAPLLIAFSCSVYQGYFAFAAGFCLMLMIQKLLCTEESPASVLRMGLRLLGMLLLSIGLYGLAVVCASEVLGLPLLREAVNSRQGIVLRVAVAYSAWLKTLTRGYFAYVNSGASRLFHALLLLCAAAAALGRMRDCRDVKRWGLLLLCVFLFPLGCYCLYLLADNSYIHSLALYPFASLYLLCALALDGAGAPRLRLRGAAGLALAVILLNNIYFANAFGLYAKLQYENCTALYTTVLARATAVKGFDGNSRLLLAGSGRRTGTDWTQRFPFERFALPGVNITDALQAEDFIRVYLGFDIPFADAAEAEEIEQSADFAAMPVYPAAGAVRKIGDVVVVKFSDRESES